MRQSIIRSWKLYQRLVELPFKLALGIMTDIIMDNLRVFVLYSHKCVCLDTLTGPMKGK